MIGPGRDSESSEGKVVLVYRRDQNLTLTIATLTPHQHVNLPNGIISMENAQKHNLYQGLEGKHMVYMISYGNSKLKV